MRYKNTQKLTLISGLKN